MLTRLSPIRDAAERHVKRYSGMQQPNAEAYQRAVLLCAACDWLECFFLETGKVPTVKELKEDSTGGRLNDRHHLETLEAVLKVLRDDKEKKHRSFKRDVCGGAGKQLWERGGAIEKPEDVPDTDKAGADAVLSRLKEAKARVIQVLPHATTAFPKGFGMGPWRERREELESVAQKWRDFIEDNAVHGTGAKEKVVENLAQKGYTLEQISKMTDAEYAEHRAEILSTLSE
ncbi:MAG: hypothetical protein GVY12_03310 [Bacteroidetes bacterium]|nr:hypothetical protein [Bacteroidota bacterium]